MVDGEVGVSSVTGSCKTRNPRRRSTGGVAGLSVAAIGTCDDLRWVFDFQNIFSQSVAYTERVVTLSRGCYRLEIEES